jgi:hypothetical protein
MASLRKRYQTSVESKDGPPVTTVPVAGAEPPPPVVDAKPPEPPAAEPSPADEAAKTALRQRLQEMENAEALQREATVAQQHPQFATEPQEQQMPTAEQIIESSGLPENAKDWLRRYPDYVLDPIKNAQMQKMHNVAEYQAGSEFTERYFDRMEILLGIKQEQPRRVQERPVTNAAATGNGAPPRRQMAAPVSAPPTRDVPSMSTGKSRSFRQPLTADELHIAQACGQTPEQYQQEKEKMLRLKASGVIQDGR